MYDEHTDLKKRKSRY